MLDSWADFRYTSVKSAALLVSVVLGASMKDMINDIRQRDKKVEEKNLKKVDRSWSLSQSKRIFKMIIFYKIFSGLEKRILFLVPGIARKL